MSCRLSFRIPLPPSPSFFPYTTLFRSDAAAAVQEADAVERRLRADVRDLTAELRDFGCDCGLVGSGEGAVVELHRDRKSTRLNSSHRCISYAVFCLKKKN